MSQRPVVGVVMGSDSDWPVMQAAVEVLDEFGIPAEADVVSAHRMPADMISYGQAAASLGLKVIIDWVPNHTSDRHPWFLDAASSAERGAGTETARHSFWAEGIYGQSIAIDPSRRLILVQWSTWEKAEMPDAFYDEQAVFFDALARSL